VAALLCVVTCGIVHADIDALKREIAKQQKAVTSAQEALKKARSALEDNQNAQRKPGADLQKLKRHAIDLAKAEQEAAESLRTATSALVSKQGELRSEASVQATAQITAVGKLDARVDKARSAVKDWRSATGEIPPAPKPRDLSGVDDEELKGSFRNTDISRLREYERWADDELKRVENEIKAADKLAAWKVAEAKNGLKLTIEAKSLKESLEARKKAVEAAKESAEKDREVLEKQR
jgi:hypothetical protein